MSREDTERLDWLEEHTTLHQFPEFSYLVDCYEISVVRTDGKPDTSATGESIRDAIDVLRRIT